MLFQILILTGCLLIGPTPERHIHLMPQIATNSKSMDLTEWAIAYSDAVKAHPDQAIKLTATLHVEPVRVINHDSIEDLLSVLMVIEEEDKLSNDDAR